MASASSMTGIVRSLVSRMVLIGRGLLGSTNKPTLSHDSANESGASCSRTSRTSFRSITPAGRTEEERERGMKEWRGVPEEDDDVDRDGKRLKNEGRDAADD